MMSFTFFLDMLGFSNKVSKITNKDEAEDFISYLKANFHTLTTISETHKKLPYKKYYDFKFALISDSIVYLVPTL